MDSQAPGKAAVHCVIIGFTRDPGTKARLFKYEHARGEAREVPGVKTINAYLVDGPNVLVDKRSTPSPPTFRRSPTDPSLPMPATSWSPQSSTRP